MASDNPTPDPRGWQVDMSLTECLRHMFDNEVGCDVTFEVHSEDAVTRISAHKFMLIARSPVFEAMFSGDFAESTENVVISDIEPPIFKELLRYIYTDDVNLTEDNVFQLTYASKKYILEGLVSECTDYLIEELSDQNVCHVLAQSLHYAEHILREICLDFIARRVVAISQTDGFCNMTREALLKVIQYDNLPCDAEAALLQGCLKWAKNNAVDSTNATDEELRMVLGEFLHEIRFLCLEPNDFAGITENSNVLTTNEKNHIFYWLLTKNNTHSNALNELGFNTTSRQMCYQRCKNAGKSVLLDPNPLDEVFWFATDKPIVLTGFSVNVGLQNDNTQYDMTVMVEDEDSEANVGTFEHKVMSDGRGEPIQVNVEKTPLRAGKFKVTVSLVGPPFESPTHHLVSTKHFDEVTLSSEYIIWPHGDDGDAAKPKPKPESFLRPDVPVMFLRGRSRTSAFICEILFLLSY